MRNRRLFLTVGACLATLTLTVGTAMADPPTPPPYRPMVGVGAQTTQDLLTAFSNVILDGSGKKVIASYDNAPAGNITTRDPAITAGCTFTRPNQGGAGVDALVAHPTCVDFARAVTDECTPRPGKNLTCIPMADDALTYAVRSDSLIARDLSAGDLTAIYNCDPDLTSGPEGIQPLLGAFGAGNRKFFLQKLGLTDSMTFAGSPGHECVKDKDSAGNPLLANDGRLLTNVHQLVTYSSAPYLAQINNVALDIHGKAVLGSINGISPAVLNSDSFMFRQVFNVVPTGQIGTGTLTNQIFVGQTSKVCANTALIKRNGFNTDPNCGSTALHTGP